MTDAAAAPPKKMSMVLKVLIGVAGVVAILAGIVAIQPSKYKVERSATIAAPAAAVFDQVNELKKWEAWSPWEKVDPAMKRTYEGPPAGTGAVYSWAGNKDVGEGRMTIVESKPGEFVRLRLEFFKPMAGKSTAEFTFKEENKQTAVTWSMTGKKNFISKAFCMFMDMDKMLGGQFDKGLGQLKSASEGPRK